MTHEEDSPTTCPGEFGTPWEELRESGLLWLINRVVFHPRGFALSIDRDQETSEFFGWSLLGDGTEPWSFPEERDDIRFAQAEAFLAAHRSPEELMPDTKPDPITTHDEDDQEWEQLAETGHRAHVTDGTPCWCDPTINHAPGQVA